MDNVSLIKTITTRIHRISNRENICLRFPQVLLFIIINEVINEKGEDATDVMTFA